MLTDPLVIQQSDYNEVVVTYNATTLVSLPLIDVATPGRTVRAWEASGLKGLLTVSHSETKENKPYGTKRVNVRNETTKVDSNGISVTQAVQVTQIFPKSAVFTESDQNVIVEMLLGALLLGSDTGADRDLTTGRALRQRILLGEG